MLLKIRNLFRLNDADRTSRAKKNIILLFLFNGISFATLLLTVPLTLDYLGQSSYGIWLTINSILVWIGYLDLGIGNGLRVKLAEAFAVNDFEKGKIYTSTAYAVFSGGIFVFFILFLAVNHFLDWTTILNAPLSLKNELDTLIVWVLFFFLLQFVLRLLTYIISADQRTALSGAITLIINVSTIIFLFLLNYFFSSSLTKLGIGTTLIPVIVFLGASWWFFKRLYRKISPSFSSVDLKYSKNLIVLGGQFFVIQAAGLIVFATDNMIITQLFGPEEVTVYNIAYRYFYFIPMLFGIFLNPVLSAYTEAYTKNDFGWIKGTTRKLVYIWIGLSALVIVMIFASGFVYRIWVGSQVKIPFSLSAAMGIFVIITNWNNIFAFFVNGIGKIRLQFYSSIIVAVINIPASIIFAKYLGFGVTGVIMGTILCLLLGSAWAPVQYYLIINRKEHGIWAK